MSASRLNNALSRASLTSNRPADNELYDRGCDLVEAAMAIHRLAASREAERAVPAVLGCIETTLHELGCAVSGIDTARRGASRGEMEERLHRGLLSLGLALADAEIASAAARGLAARTLASAQLRPANDGRNL